MMSGGLKKSKDNKTGKTFFDLIDAGMDSEASEFIKVMKGKRQYHHSKKFFQDTRTKTDQEVLKDDKPAEILFTIPGETYDDIHSKGIALQLINEYEYGGVPGMVKFLELYDCDTDFIDGS
jgi:hypothetical protein